MTKLPHMPLLPLYRDPEGRAQAEEGRSMKKSTVACLALLLG